MLDMKLEDMIRLTGFQEVIGERDAAYGEIGGFAVELNAKDGREAPFRFTFTINKSLGGKELEIGQAKLKGIADIAAASNNLFVCEFTPEAGREEDTYNEFVSRVTEFFGEVQVFPAIDCVLCGNYECDCFTRVDGNLRPIHERCLNTHQEKKSKAPVNQSYVKGLIGGLIGGIVAVIPSIITILLMDRVFSILYILIPLAIYKGYKMFGGKPGTPILIFVSLYSLLQIFVIDVISISLVLGTNIFNAMKILRLPGVFSELVAGSLFELLFIVIGIVILWRDTKKTGPEKIEEAEISGQIIPKLSTHK